jgi:hypothetical protein
MHGIKCKAWSSSSSSEESQDRAGPRAGIIAIDKLMRTCQLSCTVKRKLGEQIIIVPLLVHAASTMIIKLRITHEKYEGISRLMWQEDFLGRPSMRRINVFKLVTLFPRYIFADGSEFRTVCNNKQQGPINLATSFSSDHSTLSKAFHNV